MSFNSIGGQSGFNQAQAAAQYYKNYGAGTYEDGRTSQTNKRTLTESAGTKDRLSPIGISGGGAKQSGMAKKSSANPVVYDPRDPNGDGIISLPEELSYAAKRYRAEDTGRIKQAPQETASKNQSAQNSHPPLETGGEDAQESGPSKESSAISGNFDPRDTNRDGIVSLQEELAYAAKIYRAKNVSYAEKNVTTDGSKWQSSENYSISLRV
ncbi:MAG: hypothetical protein HGA96_00665 [Desulfobulbaceae bacterium]|nr:hypothetical protein [Desulfobulbaceae bacterium]